MLLFGRSLSKFLKNSVTSEPDELLLFVTVFDFGISIDREGGGGITEFIDWFETDELKDPGGGGGSDAEPKEAGGGGKVPREGGGGGEDKLDFVADRPNKLLNKGGAG